MSARRKIEVWEDLHNELRQRYASACVRGDMLAEENKRLKAENESLRVVDRAALRYCEAASEGLPGERLDALFRDLVDALGWMRA